MDKTQEIDRYLQTLPFNNPIAKILYLDRLLTHAVIRADTSLEIRYYFQVIAYLDRLYANQNLNLPSELQQQVSTYGLLQVPNLAVNDNNFYELHYLLNRYLQHVRPQVHEYVSSQIQ
jgi:hypothetical protein